MKQLVLLRHGAAIEKVPDVDDLNRILTPHGEQQVIYMAENLQQQGFVPERVFTSPAKRTLGTAEKAAHILNKKIKPEIQPTLYLASTADILTFIDTCEENWNSVLIVGHNPGLTECAALLAKQHVPDLKPGGMCWLKWPQNNTWEDIANGAALEVNASIM